MKNQDDWQTLGQLWISNGEKDIQGTIEIKLELEGEDEIDS
ncbi:MAG: hypothetical protein AB8B55_22435 [Mariniblastus sp.]